MPRAMTFVTCIGKRPEAGLHSLVFAPQFASTSNETIGIGLRQVSVRVPSSLSMGSRDEAGAAYGKRGDAPIDFLAQIVE